ncbi:OmpP1/FadL family transporter [Pontibacter akesuensis]|uniref:Outer membrane protein transport protein (OMPP1/FadL/TodX) n=1 Tax=Pontibacter akesuensis TaxID=388950 RepID=A0A1I7HUW1_9BACT|nr:hypothetical protein [Pontibacter akesuensis]GHA63645.1 hemin receptor [Pontibacter akesuensis]SFU64437.1 hypothetical protein SAMN04487941_1689 [Pontibacter akesuensis]
MKKTLLAILALLLGWGGTAFAQTAEDALRYSQLGVAGSARIQGIGGAQAALGADISSLFGNPAGLGMFRRSEFSITPGLQYSKTKTTIEGIGGGGWNEEESMFTVPQLGLVLSNRRADNDESDWRGVNLGIGFSRLNNFNDQVLYNTTAEAPNTIVDYFADLADGVSQGALDEEYDSGITTLEGLAYGTYLINFRDEYGNPTSFANPLYTVGQSAQIERIMRRGSQNQLDIGVGTSYKDKIYLGASLGIVTSRFTQESSFREFGNYVDTFDENNEVVLDGEYDLTLRDEFTTRGAGVNLKVGVIARPTDALRLGLSIQTPTAYSFTDEYRSSITATTVNPETGAPETLTESTLPGEFNYRLTTPFRATGGAAFFIQKYGFITADVEFVNYGGMRFSEDEEFSTSSGYFTGVNDAISNTYQSAINFNVGAEARYEAFRFRLGYAHSGDPYKNSDLDGSIKSYTVGAGVRLQNYFIDLAYVSSNRSTRYSPYTFSSGGGEPILNMDRKQESALLTVGYNF